MLEDNPPESELRNPVSGAPGREPAETKPTFYSYVNEKDRTGDPRSRALIVVPFLRHKQHSASGGCSAGAAPHVRQSIPLAYSARSQEAICKETAGLAEAISLNVQAILSFNISKPTSSALFGKGQRDRIRSLSEELKPDVIIINHDLSPVQQRNLEKIWNTKVIDRTGLILEIFGERAQTSEGKLQVELASLKYARSRLVRSWTHLERQRGGFGFVGGPGETQLEIDKRLINRRIEKIEKDLDQVRRTRHLQRARRIRGDVFTISLVGYTNAGKSTLFNSLTGESILAKDLLFATLDPTVRQADLGEGEAVLVSDTVGFISDLPTGLIAAFRATLEQINYSDIILHVRDISASDTEAQKKDVQQVLDGLGIEYNSDTRIIEVWNKADLLDKESQARLEKVALGQESPQAILMSAQKGRGIGQLKKTVRDLLHKEDRLICLAIPYACGRAGAWLYAHSRVIKKQVQDKEIIYIVEIDDTTLQKFNALFPEIQSRPAAPLKG